ncbi:MAG: GTPase Der [bacterium]|nr:GTPase Der [bacterium]
MSTATTPAPSPPSPRGEDARRQAALGTAPEGSATQPLIAIVGNPNVGKSVVFHLLTGQYVVVSNYPGTTIEISRGKATLGVHQVRVYDTPGMYSLLPVTEEERIARRILLEEHPAVVVHVVDAKNLSRMLPFTLQLLEAGLPVILVVNLLDEATQAGYTIELEPLRQRLGIPVLGMTAIRGTGLAALQAELIRQLDAQVGQRGGA